MKFVRLIFYVISVLAIGEVTGIISLCRQDAAICFSSDLMENPLEEDDTKELEEDEDYFLDSITPVLCPIRSVTVITPSLYFELAEPLHEITVPPPQG